VSEPLSLASPHDQRVSFVELFFDLVFVFSVTQVVHIFAGGISAVTIAQALLIFWMVWWGWTQFTWALNAANTDHPRVELATLVATAVAFFMAVGVPGAFAGSPLWFAVPYVAVRVVGLLIYGWVAAANEAQHAAVRGFAIASVGGLAAVLLGGWLGGTSQYWLWSLAILLDVLAAVVGARSESWDLHPDHFVERHGLIIIIALGEGLIVAAAGLTGVERSSALVAVAVLSVGVACGLWWSYFPYVKPSLETALHHASGANQAMMARDAFSLAHFPMLCGIIGFAVAVEEAVHHPADALTTQGRWALALGVTLFLGGTAIAKWRAAGTLHMWRIVLVAATAAAVALWAGPPAWGSLLVALAGVTALVASEQREVERTRVGVVAR
jgi:low temperature requirement protein LtrA